MTMIGVNRTAEAEASPIIEYEEKIKNGSAEPTVLLHPVTRIVTSVAGCLRSATDPVSEDEAVGDLLGHAFLEVMHIALIHIGSSPELATATDEPSPEDLTRLAFGYEGFHGIGIHDDHRYAVHDMDVLPFDADPSQSGLLPCDYLVTAGLHVNSWVTEIEYNSIAFRSYFSKRIINSRMTEYYNHDKRLIKRNLEMTKYKLEFYEKNARKPYSIEYAELPNGFHPKWTNTKECFDFRLSHAIRVKIRYASNGGLAGEKYIDRNGNGRIRWTKN